MQSLFNANVQEAAIENIWVFLKLLVNIEQNAFWKGVGLSVVFCPLKKQSAIAVNRKRTQGLGLIPIVSIFYCTLFIFFK